MLKVLIADIPKTDRFTPFSGSKISMDKLVILISVGYAYMVSISMYLGQESKDIRPTDIHLPSCHKTRLLSNISRTLHEIQCRYSGP